MQALEKQTTISAGEYFEAEESAEYKSEYYHGEVIAMGGASFHHNIIAGNVFAGLHAALTNSDCVVFSSDMKVQVDEDVHYTYPDISVVCGDIQFAKDRDDTIVNPILIIEILSDSTRDYDRGSKFTDYRNIMSLKDYILIDQYACHVEYFHKEDSGQWVLNEFKHLNDIIEIRSVGVKLQLNSIYNRVKFENLNLKKSSL